MFGKSRRKQDGEIALFLADVLFACAQDPANETPEIISFASPTRWVIDDYIVGPDTGSDLNPKSKSPLPNSCWGALCHRETLGRTQYIVAIRDKFGYLSYSLDKESTLHSFLMGERDDVVREFYDCYSTLRLRNAPRTRKGVGSLWRDIEGFTEGKGIAQFLVAGHGFGAALAAYLLLDLSEKTPLSYCLRGAFFGMPRIGGEKFAGKYQQAVRSYEVYNFTRDFLCQLPFADEYVELSNVTVLAKNNTKAVISSDPLANHNVLCYSAAVGYSNRRDLEDWQDLLRRGGYSTGYILAPSNDIFTIVGEYIISNPGKLGGMLWAGVKELAGLLKSAAGSLAPGAAIGAGLLFSFQQIPGSFQQALLQDLDKIIGKQAVVTPPITDKSDDTSEFTALWKTRVYDGIANLGVDLQSMNYFATNGCMMTIDEFNTLKGQVKNYQTTLNSLVADLKAIKDEVGAYSPGGTVSAFKVIRDIRVPLTGVSDVAQVLDNSAMRFETVAETQNGICDDRNIVLKGKIEQLQTDFIKISPISRYIY